MKRVIFPFKITPNQSYKQYVTLQEAGDDVLESTGCAEEDIVSLPHAKEILKSTDKKKDDEDASHRNDLVPKDVGGT